MVNVSRKLCEKLILALTLLCGVCQAENHALLVGISEYPDLNQLEGPQHDVKAINRALRVNWSFPVNNIHRLLNKSATKENVLGVIDQFYKDSKAGDNVFIYFSGHGTSQFDSTMNLPLPYTTGAFVPYDVYSHSDESELLQKLIIGNRDLRPRLKKFDGGGRHVFFVMDACYSGSTVRGKYSKQRLPTRYVNLFSRSIKTASQKGSLFTRTMKAVSRKLSEPRSGLKKQTVDSSFKESTVYPYKNIYYMSAASQYEKAADISNEWLDKFPTIDGKPHGAFTDSLLRALDKPLSIDVNNNGAVSYMELKHGVSDILQARRFNHTPQSLPRLSEDTNGLNRKDVFFMTPKSLLLASADDANQRIGMPVSPTGVTIKEKLREEPVIASRVNGVKIEVEKQRLNFFNPSGDLVHQQDVSSKASYTKQIKYFKWLDDVQSLFDSSTHKMVGEMQGIGRGSSLREGDSVGFTLYPPVDGYLMIVNFTSIGEINLLYPATEAQDMRQRSNTVLKKHDFAQVTPPFGRETAYALLFTEKLELPAHLQGASFSFNHQYATELMQMITEKSEGMRVKKFTFYTAAKPTVAINE